MDEDERVGALLLEAVRTLDPPTDRIVAGGIARGRRRARLIRGAEALTVLGVLAGVVALGVAVIPGSASTGGATRPAASRTAETATTVTVTPQALLQTALDTLPRPGTTSRYAGNSSPGDVNAAFLFDDGAGKAQIYVSLNYPPSGGGLENACQISTCTTRADGSKLAVYQGNGHPGQPSIPGKDWEISLQRTDGVVVSITEFNSAQEKPVNQTRPLPPFSIAELTVWVDRPNWQVQIDADHARAAEHLFVADDLDASARTAARKAAESKAKLAAIRARCAAAAARHVKAPSECAKLH